MKNNVELHEISGGCPAVIYPMTGCGTFMALQYFDNPNSTSQDYGRSCVRGAMHGMNPGLGIVGKMVSNPYARYAGNGLYAALTQRAANHLVPMRKPEPMTCPTNWEHTDFDGHSYGGE